MRFVIISLSVFLLDQVTKWLVQSFVVLHDSVPIVGNTVRLTFIYNQGMAFGIAIPNKLVFNVLSIIAAGAILYYIIRFKNERFLPRFSLSIIFGGAIGNLIDRIIHGRVVDFIDVDIPDIHIPAFHLAKFNVPELYMDRWPVFNFADITVSIGMFLLLYAIFTIKPSASMPADTAKGTSTGNE
jgi:signal peptidase II